MPQYFHEESGTIYENPIALESVPDDLKEVHEIASDSASPPPPPTLRRSIASEPSEFFSIRTKTIEVGSYDLSHSTNMDLREIQGHQPYGAYLDDKAYQARRSP